MFQNEVIEIFLAIKFSLQTSAYSPIACAAFEVPIFGDRVVVKDCSIHHIFNLTQKYERQTFHKCALNKPLNLF